MLGGKGNAHLQWGEAQAILLCLGLSILRRARLWILNGG